jgi:hypothetical protein
MSGRTVTRYLAFDGDFFVHNGSWDEALQAAGWYPRRKGMASILDRYRNRPDPDASTSPAALLATNLPSTGYEDTDRIDLTIGWAERPEPPVAFGDLERGSTPRLRADHLPCGAARRGRRDRAGGVRHAPLPRVRVSAPDLLRRRAALVEPDTEPTGIPALPHRQHRLPRRLTSAFR